MNIPNRSVFSAPALKRWDELSSQAQAKMLGNVWCSTCRKPVHIIVTSARIEKSDLILNGQCAECSGNVARLVEEE